MHTPSRAARTNSAATAWSTTPILAVLLSAGCLLAPSEGAARSRTDAPAPVAAAKSDPLVIVVSLRRQRLSVYDRNGPVTDSPISSGQPEFPTPTGVFSVIGKEVEHESNIYEGAAMPYMQRLTWSGTAMHAGNLPGYPASHGCIRLPYNFSKRLFDMTSINTRVIVTRDDTTPEPISHAKLFAPPANPAKEPAGEPMVQARPSKVASIADIAPALAPPDPTPGANQFPLSPRTKARLAETARLFEAIKPAEAARNVVWDNVKSANRAIETARSDIDRLEKSLAEAQQEADKAKRAKQAAEAQLAGIMRKAENARSPAAMDALAKLEDAAEARLLEMGDKLDGATEKIANLKSGQPALKDKLQAAETARRGLDDDLKTSNQVLKDAIASHAVAKRENARLMKPVSVFVSRKTQRLYVRQGFEPVLEVPVTIANREQPLGTHVFTAMGVKDTALQWTVVSLDTPTKAEEARRSKASVDTRALSAHKALDRIEFPPEALEAINDVIKPGSSLIVSDDGTSQYFGSGTDFTVAVR